jgi:two-component sensor histidine kinase
MPLHDHLSDFPERFDGKHARQLAEGSWSFKAIRWTRIELEGEQKAPGEARRIVALHMTGVLDRQQSADVTLLVSELVTNAFLHGEGKTSGIVVHLAVAPERVRVEVCDDGAGFEFSTDPLKDGHIGSQGLRILDVLASRWGVAGHDGTCVWFELDRT